ncbi:MAG: phosphatidate cytidylyltransferase [Spirochaetes bacterium]|nr:phosphatidate cytidylyltransferase [Spirochaetota bacterium]
MSKLKNSIHRILTAVVALPVYLFAIGTDLIYSIPLLIASLVITLLSLYEFYKISDRGEEGKPFILPGLLSGAVLNIIMYIHAFGLFGIKISGSYEAKMIFFVLVLLLAVVIILQLFTRPIKGAVYSIAVTGFGIFFIVFFFAHIFFMKTLENGFLYILLINIVVIINDSAAYFAGISIGKHKMNFAVSPNKSWEGYIFGMIFSIIAVIATNAVYSSCLDVNLFSITETVLIGIFLSIFGNIGDLTESLIKRDGSKKDSGSLLPGHGGMWDVFDAMIFTIPLFYYYLLIKGVS